MLVTASWIGLVASAALAIASYGATPGPGADAPATWPARSQLRAPDGHGTLIAFVHPECTCTRATLAELAEILDRVSSPPRVVAVLARSDGRRVHAGDPAARAARRLSHAELFFDDEERETHRFGAHTSGQILFYDAQGVLAFAGGITPSRGHAGASAGRERLTEVLAGRRPDRPAHVVFGCSLDREEGWL